MITEKHHRISASQIDTYEDCNRFWWFQRILKLREPPASHFTFGTVLHAVNERFLSATENGRVPNTPEAGITPMQGVWKTGPLEGQTSGEPVNLYPPGWETVTERDGSKASVSASEARLIRKLVTESIETGVLRWTEGTTVERELLLPVIEGTSIIGYIDVYRDAGAVHELPIIEDHKTYSKGSLRFLKRENSDSPNFLGANQQLKTYAWAINKLANRTGDVRVRHNQYPKFPNKAVTAVEATITAEDIEDHEAYLEDVARRMARTRKVKNWADVPGPKNPGKCSRWYGKPCPFSNICGYAETPDTYVARLERIITGSAAAKLELPPAKPNLTKGIKMGSLFDKANKAKAEKASRQEVAGTASAISAVDTNINGSTPEVIGSSVSNGAPWANPECKACNGRGLTSKHKPCPICDNTAKKKGNPTSMAYIVEVSEENKGIAVAREETVEQLEMYGMPLEWDEAEGNVAQVAAQADTIKSGATAKAAVSTPKAAKPASEPEPAVEEIVEEEEGMEPEEAPEDAPKAKARKKGSGRPTVGLTIMVGCTFLRGAPGGRKVLTSSEVLARFGTELAEDMGAESYYELDSFKRRDRLAQKADYIVGELAKHIMIHPGILGNDDEGKLVQALMSQTEGVDSVIMGLS